ncbi:MAG: sensor histidine kinase, partial [Aldersonia sp.]|nr:sensor histidine kinase [Aldersonia sp.]
MAVHIGSRGTDSVLAMVVLVVVGTAVWANVGDADTAPIAFLFAILFAAPILVRRRWPAGTLLLTAACLVVYYALGLPPIGLAVPVAVALWSAAEQGRIYWAIGTAVTLLVLSTIVRSVQGDDLGFVVGLELPTSACLMAAVVAWGDGVRARRGWQEEIATVRRMAAQQRDREVVHQIERERLHFARELHDLLGHTLTVVSLHTAAAREALHDDPARAERSLCQAGTACREATDELRATVSALREPAATVPTPGLDRVDDVLAAARAAGLDVTLRADVVAPTLPSKVSNAAYRV